MFAYGNFLTVLINFLILAWIIFLMVQAVNGLRRGSRRKAARPPLRRRPMSLCSPKSRSAGQEID